MSEPTPAPPLADAVREAAHASALDAVRRTSGGALTDAARARVVLAVDTALDLVARAYRRQLAHTRDDAVVESLDALRVEVARLADATERQAPPSA